MEEDNPILQDWILSLRTQSRKVKEIITVFNEYTATGKTGDDFCLELQQKLNLEAPVSKPAQVERPLYHAIRQILINRGVPLELPEVARNAAVATKIMSTICPNESASICDSFKRIRRGIPHDAF